MMHTLNPTIPPFDLTKLPKRLRCSICGFRIRGENHTDGDHHKRAIAAAYLADLKRTK